MQLVLEYKVNADRSVEATYRIGLQSSLYALAASGGQDPLSELRESTVAEGFVLSQYRERDYSGIVARRRFADFAELQESFLQLGRSAPFGDVDQPAQPWRLDVVEKRGLLESTYSVSAQFPLPAASDGRPGQGSGFPEMDAISRGVFEAVLRSADTRLIVDLPVAPAAHNATRVAEGGKRLEWDLFFGETNAANLEVSVPRYSKGVLILGAAFGVGAVVALGLPTLAVLLRRRRAL